MIELSNSDWFSFLKMSLQDKVSSKKYLHANSEILFTHRQL